MIFWILLNEKVIEVSIDFRDIFFTLKTERFIGLFYRALFFLLLDT